MPYCPACKLERLDDAAICPIDGRYYRIERCSVCAGEMAPSEVYCIHCGQQPPQRRAEVVALDAAPLATRGLALVIDLLCIVYLVEALPQAFHWQTQNPLLLAAPFAFVYFSLCSWNAMRTVGQQVVGLVTLRRDRTALSLVRSTVRAAALIAGLALLCLPLFIGSKSRGALLHDVVGDAGVFRVT